MKIASVHSNDAWHLSRNTNLAQEGKPTSYADYLESSGMQSLRQRRFRVFVYRMEPHRRDTTRETAVDVLPHRALRAGRHSHLQRTIPGNNYSPKITNCGRYSFKCSGNGIDGCDFFLWANKAFNLDYRRRSPRGQGVDSHLRPIPLIKIYNWWSVRLPR